MKKIILIAFIFILAIPAYFFASGAISPSGVAMILNTMTGRGIDAPASEVVASRFSLPDGFSLSLYASAIDGARFMQMTAAGDILITRPHQGEVLLLAADKHNRAIAGERRVLLQGLNRPSGIAIADGWLYIGESDGVGRVRFDVQSGSIDGEYRRVIDGLTGNGNHPYKNIGIGPDGKLYLAQGSTCNVCIEEDSRRATMSRFELDGSGGEIIASGLRNSMGFDWAPWSGELYATDNGRDLLGDDYPPCELNLIREGQFYGWPWFNGDNRPDPDYLDAAAELAAKAVAPAHEFPAHNAPLGIRFLDGDTLPADFANSALVALHGSWNRSSPDGYKVVSLHWQNGEIVQRDFFSGFEQDGDIIGRPVDIAQGRDGAIYISDDYAGAIYRIAYGEQANTGAPMSTAPLASRPANTDDSGKNFELLEPLWLHDDNRRELFAQGESLYRRHGCGSCHQQAEKSARLDLATLGQRRQYAEIIQTLTTPTAPMPAFPLSDEDKQALAAYLLATSANSDRP